MSKKQEKTVKYPYPSMFGSHLIMVVDADNLSDRDWCTCKDEHGEYKTKIDRLDNGLADPARCAESRLTKLFAGRKKEEK